MILSDAQTRGPWRKMWVRYVRSLDLLESLELAYDGAVGNDLEVIKGAIALQAETLLEVRAEIRRALTAGDAHQKGGAPGVPLPGLLLGALVPPAPPLELLSAGELQAFAVQTFRQLLLQLDWEASDLERILEEFQFQMGVKSRLLLLTLVKPPE